ncbi:SAM-dependent methyltransferase [Actinomadura geliboluensis]|uniref:SAM-dependent methyltransferase n=1 Tax=Actinomadura geliboluensis TaxID=882440 RepID=UPI00261F74A2|nr:SAM-dependent methyltransferase [Actinomadura geliboluensis]
MTAFDWHTAERDFAGGYDLDRPAMSRLWNFWGDGKDFNPADRALGETVAARFPQIKSLAQHRIAFRARVTRALAERGIDQLLVVGTDMPLRDEVHTIAQAVNPDARIVYSDADELTLLHADVFYRAEFGGCGFVQAGPDEPREVLYGAAATLNLDRPVGLLLINSLDVLTDPKAVAALAAFRAGLATGSCIAVCHLTAEHDHHLVELAGLCAAVNTGPPCIRNPKALATLYAGLEMIEPGLVPVPAWRPEPGPWPIPDGVDLWCGVGVLP